MATSWDKPQVALTIECQEGQMSGLGQWKTGETWQAYEIRLEGRGQVLRLVVDIQDRERAWELLTPAPNLEDIRYVHPLQTVCLGYGLNHPDYRFGAQWMFTPPPLVLPIHNARGWSGVAVATEPGKNAYFSVTYQPRTRHHYQLVIAYDGSYEPKGVALEVWFLSVPMATANDVIRAYAGELRNRGMAPKPKRAVPAWWAEPMVCTWGEQCNYYHHLNSPRTEGGQFAVTSYETQANQMRWLGQLSVHQIPFGVVSTSDKWQQRRYRLIPDKGRYQDFRGFADWNHRHRRHVIAWWGLWNHDGAPLDWCITGSEGEALTVDPTNPQYRQILEEDITELLSPTGYDYDGFFLDFSAHEPNRPGTHRWGTSAGIELLHDYLGWIYQVAKAAKPDAMIMTHAPHPYFADVTDVLRLNDWSVRAPNVVEQARYRHAIAAACSDWLINTDNWPMYDLNQWREYLPVQPELGIPATWFTEGVRGEGNQHFEPFTDDDYQQWRVIWTQYRRNQGLGQ